MERIIDLVKTFFFFFLENLSPLYFTTMSTGGLGWNVKRLVLEIYKVAIEKEVVTLHCFFLKKKVKFLPCKESGRWYLSIQGSTVRTYFLHYLVEHNVRTKI